MQFFLLLLEEIKIFHIEKSQKSLWRCKLICSGNNTEIWLWEDVLCGFYEQNMVPLSQFTAIW